MEATHSTHNHHRGGRHNHLPTHIMPACADLELCKAPDNPPLGERDGHGCRAGCGGRLHGMCGEQEEGESEMHHICNSCLDKKQKGSGGSSNQPKRRSPASAFLQQGASKKKASSASASRKRLTLAQKLEVLKLLDQKASLYGCTTQKQQQNCCISFGNAKLRRGHTPRPK